MSAKATETGFIIWNPDRTPDGPLDVRELVARVKKGQVAAGTWVFVNHRGVWERAADLPELQMFFQARLKDLSAQATHPHRIRGVEPRGLRRIPLLARFTDMQLERFAHFTRPQRVAQGVVVVKQGARGDAMFLVLEGNLSVRLSVDRVETELATLRIGDFFGDFALFDHGPRSADVIANTTCMLLKLTVTEFDRMSQEATDLATPFLRALGKTLTARIRAANKHHGETVRMAQILG